MPKGHWNRERTSITISSRPIRRPRWDEYPEGFPRWRMPRRWRKGDKAPQPLPAYVVHATGSVLSVWDGEKIGDARWEGRWLTRCSLHGTKAWHRSKKRAVAAAQTASFCAKCYRDAIRSMPCNLCAAPQKGCPLCEPSNT
jgi:hypothetical protein